MNLKSWLKENDKTVTAFSKELKISRNHLDGIIHGSRSPSPQLSKKIESMTNGEVTVMELLFPERFE